MHDLLGKSTTCTSQVVNIRRHCVLLYVTSEIKYKHDKHTRQMLVIPDMYRKRQISTAKDKQQHYTNSTLQ